MRARLGRSDRSDAFRLTADVRTPFGRGKAKLQCEVKPLGTAFSGTSLRESSTWTSSGSEISYLGTLAPAMRRSILRRVARCHVSCFIITKGLRPPKELLAEADARGVPVLLTTLESTPLIKQLSALLEERLALRMHLHGVLLDVFGLGVLMVGESGIGKSECALDLIDRGHRLVSDDVVDLLRMADALVGSSPDLTRNHLELRGLGVINLKDLYGVSSIRMWKRVELVVSMERCEAVKMESWRPWNMSHIFKKMAMRSSTNILPNRAPDT